jgi:hypothetical protein
MITLSILKMIMGSVKKKNVNLFGKKGKKMQKLKNHSTQTGISDASKKKS